MYYKLSNTAARTEIEAAFDIQFKHPHLYAPQVVIQGLNEATLPIIAMEDRQKISFAIWGMLPTGFTDDWPIFQSVTNTLNLQESALLKKNWQTKAFKDRRCLVIVNGFFTSQIHQGRIQPYYVSMVDKKPFLLAGIYNKTADGFLSCTILLGKAKGLVKRSQSLTDQMPLIIDGDAVDTWLDRDSKRQTLRAILKTTQVSGLEVHPIAQDLFNQDISYDSILEPLHDHQLHSLR
tara:strand:+ start:746 stop:1450 length:705 start_codon:yes stop_codon:yes gene_type:complete